MSTAADPSPLSGPPPQKPRFQLGCGVFAAGLAICIMGLFLFAFFVVNPWPAELIYHVLAGWFLHLWRAYPKFLSQSDGAGTGILFGILAGSLLLYGIHQLILWWRLHNGLERPWRKLHTFLATTMILLGSTAAIALSGLVHELAWLSQKPFTENRGRSKLSDVTSQGRQLFLVVWEHEEEHGAPPTRWSEVEGLEKMRADPTAVSVSPTGPPERYLLLPSSGSDPERPLIISPIIPDAGRFTVIRADGSSVAIDMEKWDWFIDSVVTPPTEDP